MGAVITWFDKRNVYRVLRFHVVETESLTSTLSTSDHPVEEGADITDHVRLEAKTASILGRVTQKPTRGDSLTRDGLMAGAPLPVKLVTPQPDPSFMQGGLASTIGRALSSAAEPVTVSPLQFPTQTNFFEEVLNVLFQLQSDGQFVECVTTPWWLTDAVITNVTPMRDASTGGGGTVQVDFKQITRVKLKLSNVPIATEPKMKKKISLGKQSPSKAPLTALKKKSILEKVLGG